MVTQKKYTTNDNHSQQSPDIDQFDMEFEDPDRKYDHKMYIASLGFYGLPPTWDRTFTKYLMTDKETGAPIIDEKTGKQKTTLRSCNASEACVKRHSAVWTQVNEPRDGCATFTSKHGKTYPKKAANQEIVIIRNVTLDFEYPPDPAKAHTLARKLITFLAGEGLCNSDHPIEDSGAGSHIVLPIEPIKCATPEISTLMNCAVARVVKKFIEPEFNRLCQEAGIEMDLEAYDIGRILSLPGTWRPTNPDKADADFLKDGYLRRWLEPYTDGNYPVRKENAKLTQLIQDAFVELQNEHKETAKKGKEYLKSNPNIKAGNLPPGMTDDALITWIMGWKNGDEFRELYYGGNCGHNSPSSGDLAFCNILAAATGKDAARMDSIFRTSPRMRDKWDRKARDGETYGEGTIQRAIEGCTFEYDPNYGKQKAKRLEEDLKEMIEEYQAKYAKKEEQAEENTSEEQDSSNEQTSEDADQTDIQALNSDQIIERIEHALASATRDEYYAGIFPSFSEITRDMLSLSAKEQDQIELFIFKRNEKLISRSFEKCLEEAKKKKKQKEEEDALNQVKELLNKAIEEGNVEAIYALTSMIVLLPAQDRATIKSILESRKKAIPGFSISAYNDCIKEAVKALKQKKFEERHKNNPDDDGYSPYYASQGSMWLAVESTERNPDPDPIQISNFTAKIVADVTTDDGAEKKRSYELEADLHGRLFNFEVPVEEYARCDWMDTHIGARATITVAPRMKDHLAAAIKHCSSAIEKNQYAHTGWRKINGIMVYLHNDGCLSEVSGVDSEEINYLTHTFFSSQSAYRATPEIYNSSISEVSEVREVNIEASVKLTGSLSNYVFPSERENMQQAIRASLQIVDITQDTVTMPLYSAIWRAPLGNIDFGEHVAGPTGIGKSELVALMQQHYGVSMDSRNFPGSWDSTKNALEMKLSQTKDALFGLDDFKPKGSRNMQDQLHAKADDVFRAVGNGSARDRLDANINLRVGRYPRCLLISTGEDIPKGQSCQSRMIVVSMTESITKGEAAKRLSIAQRDARDGLYAQALAGYIEWLAPRIESIQAQWISLRDQERNQLSSEGHSRAGTNTANLILGMKCFLQYACEMGAITPQDAEKYLTRCTTALVSIASDASIEDHQMKPTEQWKRLLVSAISGNHAHLVTPSGDNPGPGYGWKKSVRSYTNAEGFTSEDETYSGGGSQIGWIDGDDIYLDPTASYAAVLSEGSRSSDNITVSKEMLQKQLVKDGMLESTDLHKDKDHRSIAVRKRLQGSQKYVLHIKKETLFPNDPLSESPPSPHLPHSETHESASEEASGVSEVDHSQKSEGGDFPPSQTNQRPLPLNRPCFKCGTQDWQWDELLETWTCGGCNHG